MGLSQAIAIPHRVEFTTSSCDCPCPIYDFTNNLIPYLWRDAVEVDLICEGLFVDGLIDNDGKVASKNTLNSRLECKNHNLFMTDQNG